MNYKFLKGHCLFQTTMQVTYPLSSFLVFNIVIGHPSYDTPIELPSWESLLFFTKFLCLAGIGRTELKLQELCEKLTVKL
jgi:hypothetical protein